MKKNPVIGITAEWNPFHSGHAAMIKEIRKSFPDARIISAMSGSFVQNRWIRISYLTLPDGCRQKITQQGSIRN